MAGREERIAIFHGTLQMITGNSKLKESVAMSVRNQMIIWQEDSVDYAERWDRPAKVLLSAKRTLEAAEPYVKAGKKVCILNFASSVTPGGGVTKGTSAQEESICRISTLYPVISDSSVSAFYERHWQMIHNDTMGRENRDDCIYSPGIYVIREDTFDCEPLPEDRWFQTDVITCAAPDLRISDHGRIYRPSSEELMAVHQKRFARIFSLAAKHEVDVLILGAFGCGAFANPPEIVVQAINSTINSFLRCFETIEFAVFTNDTETLNYQAFRHITGIEEDDQSTTRTKSISFNPPIVVDLSSLNRTIQYICHEGWGIRDEDTIDPTVIQALEKGADLFGGGSGGICTYKLFQYFSWYIQQTVGRMRFRYVAAALSCLGHGDFTIESFRDAVDRFIQHRQIGSEYLFYAGVSQSVYESILESYRTTGCIESYTMLKVMKALEWDEQRISALDWIIKSNILFT